MCGPHCMDITRMKLFDIDIKFKLFSLYDQYQSKHGYKSRPRILSKEEALRQYNQCNCTGHQMSIMARLLKLLMLIIIKEFTCS